MRWFMFFVLQTPLVVMRVPEKSRTQRAGFLPRLRLSSRW